MTYFTEISNYKTYSGKEDDFHFNYNANSGGGQAFLGGQFYNENGQLVKTALLNGREAKFKVKYSDEENQTRSIILDDTVSVYEIKPRAENDPNMKFEIKNKESPSKIMATFFMLPNTCGVKKTTYPDASALSINNFWLQSMWLNADISQPRSVILTPRDCVFSSLNSNNPEKLRCFSFNINQRIIDIINIAKKSTFLNNEIAICIEYFADIYKGIRPFNFVDCQQTVKKLMSFLSYNFPDTYSGIIDPLPYVTYILENKTKRVNIIHERKKIENIDHLLPYFTAIRTKPFLLLAGISGTGKSRLARQLAQATATENLADDQKPGNYELIPVKPNWHDSTELLGYVSRISGTPEYVMTDFVRFLFKAMLYPETPFFLCLDEMNLAPVEQYFAEYLSVIETRSKLSDGSIVTDVLVKFGSEIKESFMQQLKSYYDSLNHNGDFKDIWQQIEKDCGLRIPPNLVVIGTVNMDETTFSFSRKVLDRAMSFELNVVDMNDGVKNDNAILPKIPSEAVTPKLLTANDAYTACSPVAEYVLERLTKINDAMKDKPFKIAYRSRNEIMVYVYERMSDSISMDTLDDNSIRTSALFHQAMDEAISMKILSRIEGDEQRISVKFLDELKDAISGEVQISLPDIDDDIDNQTEGSLSKTPGNEGDDDKPYPICIRKLEQMKKQLVNGYVSFWS